MNDDIIEFIKSNRNLLDRIIDIVPVPLFVKDREGRYIDCNIAFKNFLSVSREQIIGKTIYDMWNKEEADVFFTQDNELFDQGGLQIYETKITSSEGVHYDVQFHKQVFTNTSGAALGFLGAIFDITEEERLESALTRLASTDELTGLPNRREGMKRIEALHTFSERKKRPYCVAILDLGHFKSLNDRYGHTSGDLVLQAFSTMVRGTLRSSDLCFRYDCAARYQLSWVATQRPCHLLEQRGRNGFGRYATHGPTDYPDRR
jgi:PAS domain S-box-containing protein